MQKIVLVGLTVVLTLLGARFDASAAIVLPPSKSVTLLWEYPASELSSDIVFNVYATKDLSAPLQTWSVVTNVASTSCVLPAVADAQFFTVAASNKVTGLQAFAR